MNRWVTVAGVIFLTLGTLFWAIGGEMSVWLLFIMFTGGLLALLGIWGGMEPKESSTATPSNTPPEPASVAEKTILRSARSWQGSVIRTIIQKGEPLTWKEIQEATNLDEGALNRAIASLIKSKEIHKITTDSPSRYQVADTLSTAYSNFDKSKRTQFIDWINKWKEVKNLDFSLEQNHFFLEGRYLDDFSKELISHASLDILLANPFINECDLSNGLREAKKRGVEVHIVTRPPVDKNPEYLARKKKFHQKLKEEGISLTYVNRVHAKLIIVDEMVAVVSSMNFYDKSSAGGTWEAGLVTIDKKVVNSIASSLSRID